MRAERQIFFGVSAIGAGQGRRRVGFVFQALAARFRIAGEGVVVGKPARVAGGGELLAQGKANLQAPWLALTGFFTIAVMLSLLVFVGEAVRDAFDPRKKGVG